MTFEQNKATVRRFYAAFEADDQDVLNTLLAPELKAYHSHSSSGPQSRDVHLQGICVWHTAFSETRFLIDSQIAEGDQVASRVTMHAFHNLGDFQGMPPTGKRIAVPATSIERIVHGAIVERHVYSDWYGMLQQLGLLPPP